MRIIDQVQTTTIALDDQLIIDNAVGGTKAIKFEDVSKKIQTETITDGFVTTKDYAIGDYCIYLNRLYKFIAAKSAGPWDGTKVTPILISQELQEIREEVGNISDRIGVVEITAETDGAGRLGTSFNTLQHSIIGAQFLHPNDKNEQAYVNVSSDPGNYVIFVDCPQHPNETITVKLVVYKFT